MEDFRRADRLYSFLWLDALVMKSSEGRRIVNMAVIVEVDVNGEGQREILGVDVMTPEDGAGRLAFLLSLVSRGLAGVV